VGLEKDLAEFLVCARITRGLNRAEVARALGVTRAAISQLEKGRHCPELKTLLKLQPVLRFDWDEFVAVLKAHQEESSRG
jgi:DNA-binding XRE family transcriptional regulator